MQTIEGTIWFYKTFDGLSIEFYCNCDGQIFQLTPGMKFEDLLKKIFSIK